MLITTHLMRKYLKHSVTLIFFRQTSDKEKHKTILEALWDLLPSIHLARSSAAVHWMSVMLLDFLEDSNKESILEKLTEFLIKIGQTYGDGLTETQKIIDTK